MAKRQYTGDPIDMTQQHISERALDEEAEDVEYATESEMAGQESVDFWPSSATPREDLNETQVAIIEAAADPTTEYETTAELSRQVAPEFSQGYAYNVLWNHWPESELTDPGTDHSQKHSIKDPKVVDEMRHRLVDGESSGVLGEEFDVSKDVVLNASKELYDVYEKMPTQTEPVEYTGDGWSFVEEPPAAEDETTADGERGAEDDSDVDDACGEGGDEETLNYRGQSVKTYETTPSPAPDPDEPVASGDGSSGDGSNCVAAAVAAIVVWELARRVVGRLR